MALDNKPRLSKVALVVCTTPRKKLGCGVVGVPAREEETVLEDDTVIKCPQSRSFKIKTQN
ncbi:hypothetical protein OLK001_30890 [Synechocystis sp. LKSZ1]